MKCLNFDNRFISGIINTWTNITPTISYELNEKIWGSTTEYFRPMFNDGLTQIREYASMLND